MKQNGWRWGLWLLSIAVLLVVGFQWSEIPRIEDEGNRRIVFALVEWGAMFGAVLAFPNLDRRRSLLLLTVAAVLVRLSFWGAPVSNDVNRYLWEGRLLGQGENPYATEADDERWAHLRDRFWEGMNTRDRMTAYPPGMELVMAAASQIWYHLHVFKVVALLGDLWIFALLAILSREYLRPVRWLGFYAFNPIVLSSFAVEAHFDSLMVAPMLTALWLASREKWQGAWFWLGFAVQMKFMALLLVPVLLLAANRREVSALLRQPFVHGKPFLPRVFAQSWPFLLVLVLPSLIFWKHLGGLAYGFFAFGSQGAFNGGFFESLRLLGVPMGMTRILGTFLFAVGVSVILLRFLREKKGDLFQTAFWLFQLLLIFSPVVHFWYLTWVAWFLVIRPSMSLLVLCGTLSAYFLAWTYSETGWGWGYPRTIVVGTWIPFFALILWENRYWRSRRTQAERPTPQSVSIVVPVYREGDGLPSFLTALSASSPRVREIIVVDGAGDLVVSEVESIPLVRVLSSGRGRGLQIATGLDAASGDLVAIVHADTQPRSGWAEEVLQVASKCPKAPAFALGQRFSEGGIGLLGVEALNEMRATLGGSIFGDQTMIVRREALAEVGGFPQQPLMEDVEVSCRLRSLGELVYLGREWTVSARKWEGRFTERFTQIVGLMLRYGANRLQGRAQAEQFSKTLFQEYYPERKEGKED